MTLPEEKIGDRGQRYQVDGYGYPRNEGWHPIGYVDDSDRAVDMVIAIMLAPGIEQARIIDRERKPRMHHLFRSRPFGESVRVIKEMIRDGKTVNV